MTRPDQDKIEAILFDLDGTLIDTAPDLVAVLNRMLVDASAAPMPYAIARNEVSGGAPGLLRLGFGTESTPEQLEQLRQRFHELYAADICINSRFFISLHDLHDLVCNHGLRWGIVTNKPRAMTLDLLERLGVGHLPGSVVSGDQLAQRKPHPAPLLFAAEELEVDPQRCIYIGDAQRDIQAGRAAGMTSAVANYGYIRPAETPDGWGADHFIRHPRDLIDLIARL